MPVIEKAIETAALMPESDRSRGYCLEMICADFLAGPTSTTAIRRCCCSRWHGSSDTTRRAATGPINAPCTRPAQWVRWGP